MCVLNVNVKCSIWEFEVKYDYGNCVGFYDFKILGFRFFFLYNYEIFFVFFYDIFNFYIKRIFSKFKLFFFFLLKIVKSYVNIM